jgi:predicted ABC-type exoprotein transport system permease subunit
MNKPEQIAIWLSKKLKPVVEASSQKLEARHKKALKDSHTLEILLLMCVVLFLMAMASHMNRSSLASIISLAGVVVCVKFLQLFIIWQNKQRGGGE